jgi:prepilin-type N-terminal cleavage/methylation domain-containing protein
LSYHSPLHKLTPVKQKGFTLTELLIVIVMIGFMVVAMFTFFKTSLFGYLDLQKTASNFTDLAQQSQRIGNVVRGTTGLIDTQNNSLEMYAYFYPTDTYVSKIKYYLNTDSTQLMADVTPMTANPPIGTEVTANKKTYTIIGAFKQLSGVKLFEYVNSANSTLTPPIADLYTVKTIRINLGAATASTSGNQVMTLEINLRNRKTNL